MTNYSLADVAKLVSIKAYRITYAISVGLIPEPESRIAGKRCFSTSDLSTIKKHFETVSQPTNKAETRNAV